MTEKQGRESIKGAFLTYDKNKTKPIAGTAIMSIIIVIAAILLSGLALSDSYRSAIAQEELMGEGEGAGGITANGSGTAVENATTAAGGNQTTTTRSALILHLEEARTALQNNDTQNALMHLDLALMTLGGATGGTQGTEEEYSECGGVTVGGTSAADDYGCPPDPDW